MGLNQRTDDRADDGQGTGERPVPRHGRAALLRLASWFEEAGPERADDLARAAYALHPALHLEGRVDEGIAATTGWWQAEPDRSPVVEHPGTRPPAPVRDHRAQQARLRDAAESSAHWRRAGASQIRALLTEPTGDRARVDLSGAGMEVLMELLTAALGAGDAARSSTSAGDLEFSLRLHVVSAPGAEVTVQGEGGDLTLEGVRLCVTPYEQHVLDLPESGERGDGATFGLGRPRGASRSDARPPSEAAGTPEPSADRTGATDGSEESTADEPTSSATAHPPAADELSESATDRPTGPATDVRARSGADRPTGSGPDALDRPASDRPAASAADALAGPGTDHVTGSEPGAPDEPATDRSEEHGADDLLGPAPAGSGGFAELAGAVSEALALARAEEEPADPAPTEEEPATARSGDDDAVPTLPAPVGRRHARPEAAPSDDESSGGPVEDPRTTDSLAEPDRDRRPDPNTETTGPIDLSAIRDGERSAWG
ncbi:DUF2397 family protein [Nocardiopsis sp. NRRL B-16309]|uniref:DUF2397 family protein n=1 Tax=Nocardiopsis sp. NRRL B-16309 TaxID=1519494 RepID=UPI0009EB16B7|nr:DUF2397 family protein [Nocardiopsis sp. NRRL B-16309]